MLYKAFFHKSANFYLRSKSNLGRSMVEMLGVLAIIGVLSVGAMNGYSKAMYKYKLNKQIDTYNQIFAFVEENLTKFNGLPDGTNLQSYLYRFGSIPKNQNTDVFNNTYLLRKYSTYLDLSIMLFSENEQGFFTTNSKIAVCKDLFTHLIIPNRNRISSTGVMLGMGGTEDKVQWKNAYFGDGRCNGIGKKCLSDITMSDIASDCDACKANRACRLYFTFTY